MINTLSSIKTNSNINWEYLFSPNSVAVIGASDKPGTWGYGILSRVLASGKRKVYAVNPNASEILGLPAYDSVVDIPDSLDFAAIAVPATKIAKVLQECIQKQIKAAVIISGGFAETDEEGRRLEAEIVSIARQGGINFIGPNCMGHADTSSHFSTMPWISELLPGSVGLVCQSGNVGSRILRNAPGLGIGFSKFICTGNEAELHLEDYLEYLSQDEATTIIALYIEGLREARRFYQLAKKTTMRKPIVVLKAGAAGESARAARSHTGAFVGSETVYATAFRQAGVIRVDDDDELCDMVATLLNQPLPRSNRVAVLTTGGGLGVVAAEVCEKEGLVLTQLSPSTIEKFNAILPRWWSHGNPVDTVGISSAVDNDIILFCLWTLLEDENVDAIILQAPLAFGTSFLVKTFQYDGEAIRSFQEKQQKNLKMVKQRAWECGKPVFAVNWTPAKDLETLSYFLRERIPTYVNPRRAARILRHLVSYRRYLDANQT